MIPRAAASSLNWDDHSGCSISKQLTGVLRIRSSDFVSFEIQRAGTRSGIAASTKSAASMLTLLLSRGFDLGPDAVPKALAGGRERGEPLAAGQDFGTGI